jgi:hypothetical protein
VLHVHDQGGTAAEERGNAAAERAVDPETGTATWPGGADLAPDTLYRRVSTGRWPEQSAAA